MRPPLAAALIALALSLSQAAVAQDKTYTIGILNWQQSPYSLEAVEGFRQAVDLTQVRHTFLLADPNADPAKATEALQQWKQRKVDLVLAIGAKASLLALKELPDTPVIFIAAPDPGLPGANDPSVAPHRNATGSLTRVDMAARLHLFREALPDVKALGVVYDPNDPIAASEIADARRNAKEADFTLHEATATQADQIAPAVEKLIQEGIGAMWIPTDTLICGNLSQVARVTTPKKLPVVTSAPEGMAGLQNDSPALVAVAADYGQLGRLSAETAIDILTTGKNPADIPVRNVSPHVVIVSIDVARTIDYTVPPALLTKAHKVLRGFEGQTITIAGTGDNQDLLRALAKAMLGTIEGGRIDVPETIGSTGGIRALQAGKTDLARIARDLSDEETKAGLTAVLFAKAPIVFVVHPSVTGIDNISSQDIVGIYSGRIAKWEQLGAKEGRIYAVTRESGDASLRALNALLPGFADIKEPNAKVIYTTPEARDALVGHRNTFGFLPTSTAAGTDLRILSVDGIAPSAESVRNGSYKLVVPFSLVYKDPPTGLAKRFVDFLFTKEAQDIMVKTPVMPVDRQEN